MSIYDTPKVDTNTFKNNSIEDNQSLAEKKVRALINDVSLQNEIIANIGAAARMATATPGFFDKSTHLLKQKTGTQSLINALILLELVEHCKGLVGGETNIADEMMKGAHVVLKDNGVLMDFVSRVESEVDGNQKQVMFRYSSHYHQEKKSAMRQKETSLSDAGLEKKVMADKSDCSFRSEIIFNECVFGSFIDKDGNKYSWLQFEGHSHQARTVYDSVIANLVDTLFQLVNYSLEKFSHHIDWLFYVVYYKREVNVGQYGNSEHAETNNPLVITDSGLKKSAEQVEEADSSELLQKQLI